MAEYDEEGIATAAAKILLGLRNRKLQRWPAWVLRSSKEPAVAAEVQRPSEEPAEAEVELPPLPQLWPKRRRAQGRWKAATAWPLAAGNLLAHMGYGTVAGSGASCRGHDVARSPPPRVSEKPKVKAELMAARRAPETPLHCGAAAGSGPLTSGVGRAREEAQAEVAVRKDATEVSSPETPLDYATAAESGASSSGVDGARPPAKRKSPGAGGSGGGSSGDDGCSSPAKRTRADAAAGDSAGQATSAADKVEEPKKTRSDYRDEKGCLLFDLNEDAPWEED